MTDIGNTDVREKTVDCVYIAGFTRDSRLTRICVASVRYFYPDIPIRVLPGSPLRRNLVNELARYWNTTVADLPGGDYGSGFVKLEPLFAPAGERFLMLDADTVIVGPVLDLWQEGDAPFVMDEEELPDEDMKRLYFDWDKLTANGLPTPRPLHVFNTGQWFGTGGVLTREDFASLVEWTMPRRLRHPKLFMTGDQGIQNYVFNEKARAGTLHYRRRKIMRWPLHSMEGLAVDRVAKRQAPPVVVHWAGIKKWRLGGMVGSELLEFFEKYYYSRVPLGDIQRIFRSVFDVLSQWLHDKRVRIRMRLRKYGMMRA